MCSGHSTAVLHDADTRTLLDNHVASSTARRMMDDFSDGDSLGRSLGDNVSCSWRHPPHGEHHRPLNVQAGA